MTVAKVTDAQRPQMSGLEKVKAFFKNEKVQLALKVARIALIAIAAIAAMTLVVTFASPIVAAVAGVAFMGASLSLLAYFAIKSHKNEPLPDWLQL